MIKKVIGKAKDYILNGKALSNWNKYSSPKLEQFKNKYKDQDCFIVGNGPSLNKMNLSLLNNYYTFGLNKIYLIFSKNPFNIDFLVAVNPFVIKQSSHIYKEWSIQKFISYKPGYQYLKDCENTFYLGDIYPQKLFYKDITEGITQGHTVTFVAMQIAYYMGFRRIFLVGVDHNFVQHGKPNEKQIMTKDDPNHFDPNYFKGYEWQLADLENSELFYLIARYYFQKDGREIYDATINGKLNIFKKIEFERALEIAKRKDN